MTSVSYNIKTKMSAFLNIYCMFSDIFKIAIPIDPSVAVEYEVSEVNKIVKMKTNNTFIRHVSN